ncbi:MAG: hypothetical protein K1W22_18105 [Lachnospiraceae bacterium]
MEKDLMDLSGEISAVSMIITGLSNDLDEDCSRLNPKALQTAMFGVANYLDRIADDLNEMSVC